MGDSIKTPRYNRAMNLATTKCAAPIRIRPKRAAGLLPSRAHRDADVHKLNRLLQTPDTIAGEDFAILLSTKCGSFRQIEIKEHRGHVCLFVHTTSYLHESIANHFYDRAAERLNALRVSYHVITTIRRLEDELLEEQVILPLGIQAVGDPRDPRDSEWDL